jgi:zinc dependent phospholipase C
MRSGARSWRSVVAVALAFACTLALAAPASAYSALAHEAIIDAAWAGSIVPALRARFPSASDDDLKRARAFAYGGSLIQDIGYYPFSSRFFGDLTHYVRSGDFVEALIREAADVTEYAFALGALAHYAADNTGHPLAVNRAVPVLYPKLRQRFGDVVNYGQNPAAHLKTEFGFDVVQVARGQYASGAFHDFIGFEVSKPVMERAFKTTYGLDLNDVFAAIDVSIATFRWTVNTTIPGMTKVAWDLKEKEIVQLTPSITREQFVFSQTRAEYERRWGSHYKRPGWFHRLLAMLMRIVPRVGPFKPLAFVTPTADTEKLFVESFARTVTYYRSLIDDARHSTLAIANRNFDTGAATKPGKYPLADTTYAQLVERLAKESDKGSRAPVALIADIRAFYADRSAPIETKQHRKDWNKLMRALEQLNAGQ